LKGDILVLRYDKYLVTGGAGFIGSHLCEEILNEGKEVICIDNLSFGRMENIIHLFQNPKFRFVNADISDLGVILDYFKDVDIIFHNAASKSIFCKEKAFQDFLVNVQGTWNVFESARLNNVKKIIHASSASIYGEATSLQTEAHQYKPISYYGVSKLAGERYLEAFRNYYGLNYVILRYCHVFGPRQDSSNNGAVIPIFIRRALSNEPLIIYGDGMQVRQFTYYKDIVKANLLMVNSDVSGKVFNVASRKSITILELANEIVRLTNSKSELIFKPDRLGDVRQFNIVSDKIIDDMGMQFSEFDVFLLYTIEWYKRELHII